MTLLEALKALFNAVEAGKITKEQIEVIEEFLNALEKSNTMVLNDGGTFSGLEGCSLAVIPDDFDENELYEDYCDEEEFLQNYDEAILFTF